MRAILAGGGTGGHVIPALAIAQELRARFQAELLFIGTSRGIENRLVPAAGYPLRLIEIGALKKVSLATRLKTLFDLPLAIAKAYKVLAEFQPDVVIGVGGYASGPAMMAAVIAGIRTVVFEPNLVPGFANRILGPMVAAAAVHFEQTCRYFRGCHVTGVPVRQAFFGTCGSTCDRVAQPSAAGPEQARATGPHRITLLVFGGSQGAHVINQTVINALPAFGQMQFPPESPACASLGPALHIIHQTGERDYNDAQAAYLRASVSAEIYPFIEDMPGAFARADLLLCRSGASTVAEITAAGKPAIFVPFPHAADDHQTRNAEALVRSGAALLIRESELTPERLVDTVSSLLHDRARLVRMAAAARSLSHPHAARDIALLAARVAGFGEGIAD